MNSALPQLKETSHAFCIAPAGSGKTETIIDLCAYEYKTGGKQLILTHTHAGVHSIKRRIYSKGHNLSIADVNTIDSFCIDWVKAYPQLSGLQLKEVTAINWYQVRIAFLQLIKNSHIRNVIQLKWKGLIVDEYQDCGQDQHQVVLGISRLMKTRIFGDPLQGIFDFDDSRLNWDDDVAKNFTLVTFDPVPARWMKTAPELGMWLLEKRKEIIETGKLSLNGSLPKEVTVIHAADYRRTLSYCSSNHYNNSEDSHLIIHHQAAQCHTAARNLGATFRSIEELEFDDLHDFARRFDNVTDEQKAGLLLEFVGQITTGITKTVKETIQNLLLGKQLKHKNYKENQASFDKIAEIFRNFKTEDSAQLLLSIKKLSGVKIFRRETWYLAIDALDKHGKGIYLSLLLAVTARTNQYRYAGRMEDRSTVGRIRLVKGLEYDHVYLLNFHQYSDPREAYVALTRGKKSLTIFTDIMTFSYSNPGLPQLLL